MVRSDLGTTGTRALEAFRLVDDILEVSSAASVSSDKQRIDAMFDETRSTISRTPPGKGMRRAAGRKASSASTSSVADNAKPGCVTPRATPRATPRETPRETPPGSVRSTRTANAVQVRIENMFAEMSAAGGPQGSQGNRFSVDYLGSVPIADKVTTLQGLQEPLKQLYVSYRRTIASGGALWEPGFVDISAEGLKVHHGRCDQLNPFPTIAVWAAVKFVCRANTSGLEYAFLPLIADPDGVDRDALFQVMSCDDQRALCPDVGAPMFAVVMRKVGVSRQLQCHAFVCSSSEDAVVMAANLYQALMTSMRAAAASRMHHENGFGRVSIAGSVCGDEEVSSGPPPAPPPVPKRPPRKKKTSQATAAPTPAPIAIASLRGNYPSNRRASLSKTSSNSTSDPPSGDILTKVAIPRSRSFLHANGPLMRYGRRGDAALPAPPTASASPLGFHELFAEFRQQEGLESLDDILGAIIDAEGMSFNDLKPIYKEFLLKLALTLTKDELYQRSKHIMHKQRKKQREARRRRGFGVAAAHIKRALRRSLGRLRQRVRRKSNKTSASAYVRNKQQQQQQKPQQQGGRSVRVSQTVENACNVNVNVSISNARGNKARQPSRRRSVAARRSRSTTSEDSDLFTTIRCDTNSVQKQNYTKSGYVSYSDCGYDSESCTCASAERCYCSHRGCSCDTDSCVGSDKCYCTRPRPRTRTRSSQYPGGVLEQLKRQGFVASESSLSRAASPSTAWRRNERRLAAACAAASAGSVRSTKSLEFVHMWPPSLKSASLKPSSRNANRMDMYRTEERKALIEQTNRRSRQQRKVLVVSARDPKGRVVYMGASCRNEMDESVAAAAADAKPAMSQFFPRATLTSDRRRRSSSASATGDVFSVKKSAEIAALFANVKMSQTTDIIARSTDATGTDASTTTTTYSSLDGPTFAPARRASSNGAGLSKPPRGGPPRGGLESSLGYLP